MNNLQSEINTAIQNRLSSLKMTKSELARLAAISPQHIGQLLKGTKKWNTKQLSKAFDVLGINIQFKIVKRRVL